MCRAHASLHTLVLIPWVPVSRAHPYGPSFISRVHPFLESLPLFAETRLPTEPSPVSRSCPCLGHLCLITEPISLPLLSANPAISEEPSLLTEPVCLQSLCGLNKTSPYLQSLSIEALSAAPVFFFFFRAWVSLPSSWMFAQPTPIIL